MEDIRKSSQYKEELMREQFRDGIREMAYQATL